jgi:hypothetical protein
MASYYVTQLGTGSTNGSSLANAATMAKYVANTMVGSPTGGDTVYFSGVITAQISVATSGTGNGAGRLILDISGASLIPSANSIYPIYLNGQSYITINGGGSFAQAGSGSVSTHTTGGTITPFPSWYTGVFPDGAWNGTTIVKFNPSVTSHDITIDGLTSLDDVDTGLALFIDPRGESYNVLIQNCYIQYSSFCFFDGLCHDITFKDCYCITSKNDLTQTDVIGYGDGYNITIDGCLLINQSVSDNATGRHNDIIQTFHSGSSGGSNPNPYNLIVKNSRLELQGQLYGATHTAGTFQPKPGGQPGAYYTIVSPGNTSFTAIGAANNNIGTLFQTTGVGTGTGTAKSTATGDMSWMMLEDLTGATQGSPIFTCFNCVFVGAVGLSANNGLSLGSSVIGEIAIFNNTIYSVAGAPGNTLNIGGTGKLLGKGNIIYDTVGAAGTNSFSGGTGTDVDYNFYYQEASTPGTGANGSTVLNPTFISFANLGLNTGSPLRARCPSFGAAYATALANGTTFPAPIIVARAGDAGAYQFVAGGGALPGTRRICRYLRLHGPAS